MLNYTGHINLLYLYERRKTNGKQVDKRTRKRDT